MSPSKFLKLFGLPLIYFAISILIGGALALSTLPVLLSESVVFRILSIMLLPVTFPLSMILIAAILNRPFQKSVVSGIFPRKVEVPIYFGRRMYGSLLGTIMQLTGVYYLILTFPWFKKALFRSFGYEGEHCEFTSYADTWMRDLKLLEIGKHVYLAGGAAVGTNICTPDGKILVGRIKIGEGTLVGRDVILGPGSRLGIKCDLGIKVAVGIRSIVMNRVKIGGGTGIAHGVVVEDDVQMGEHSFVGTKSVIHSGIKIPSCAFIKPGSILLKQEDVDSMMEHQNNEVRAAMLHGLKVLDEFDSRAKN